MDGDQNHKKQKTFFKRDYRHKALTTERQPMRAQDYTWEPMRAQDSDEVLLQEVDEAVCGRVVGADLRVVLQLRLDLLRQLLPEFNAECVCFQTALHWAAKQGGQEAVELMLLSGADVNVRSHGGYTALHLASIHGHQPVVHALISCHNAKPSLRDYHGRTASHYWSGCSDVFNRPPPQSGVSFSGVRRTQRYALPSLLTRSRSQGQISLLEFGTLPQSASHHVLDLQV
ncbi:ankyrin repeat and protein kinase domain-containing protein 1-like [Cottoperca gobio]|uniref:Ankyrin repeat and protein kinase domain-containing protein 1-like n=1 Tax=Cottoperca gobio TaxID=56716 RepID=A0A6J2PCV7_COTGO|nr:ankyrin repeat and protein kinase domain-containing protein 1-like [Cottoperca gobio]